MKHEKDLELQELFQRCKSSLVYEFCKINYINTDIYEDSTGIRFFLYYNKGEENDDRIYCSPDNGFTYYITYTMFKEELINKFRQFNRLKVFL